MPFSPLADLFFITITCLGSVIVLLPGTVALAFLLHRRNLGREAMLLTAGLGLTVLMVHGLKLIVKRPRPELSPHLLSMPTSWSFPSAHTAQAASFFFALALIAARHLPGPAARLTGGICLLAPLMVGYSRVYLQVHYPTDVLAGLLVGGCGLLIAAAWYRPQVKL